MEGLEFFGYILGGIVIAGYVLFIVFPFVLDIIWIKKLKNKTVKPVSVLGIVAVLYTAAVVYSLPEDLKLIGDFWKFFFK